MTSTSLTSKPVDSRSLLRRDHDFARLWLGESVSAVGTQISLLAIPLVAVQLLNATPGQMGMLGALGTIPYLLFAVLAGVWVDRSRKRPLLIGAHLAEAALLLLIPVLAMLDVLRLGHLYAIVCGLGIGKVLFEVAYQSYLSQLVQRDDLVQANSRLSASTSVAEIAGPGRRPHQALGPHRGGGGIPGDLPQPLPAGVRRRGGDLQHGVDRNPHPAGALGGPRTGAVGNDPGVAALGRKCGRSVRRPADRPVGPDGRRRPGDVDKCRRQQPRRPAHPGRRRRPDRRAACARYGVLPAGPGDDRDERAHLRDPPGRHANGHAGPGQRGVPGADLRLRPARSPARRPAR